MESSKTSQVLWAILFAIMAGLSLALFSIIGSMIKYLFSLLTLYIGIRYFRRTETTGMRILFVVLAVILYFLFVIIITAIGYINDNPDLFTSAVSNG